MRGRHGLLAIIFFGCDTSRRREGPLKNLQFLDLKLCYKGQEPLLQFEILELENEEESR
jgi:hypothetical protein